MTQRLMQGLIEENAMMPLEDSMDAKTKGSGEQQGEQESKSGLIRSLGVTNASNLEARVRKELEDQGMSRSCTRSSIVLILKFAVASYRYLKSWRGQLFGSRRDHGGTSSMPERAPCCIQSQFNATQEGFAVRQGRACPPGIETEAGQGRCRGHGRVSKGVCRTVSRFALIQKITNDLSLLLNCVL